MTPQTPASATDGSCISALAAALQGEAGFPARQQMTPVRHRGELPLDFTISDFPTGR